MNDRRSWKLKLGTMSLGIILLDWFTGPFILIPLTFVVPVSLASWYLGRKAGILLACVLPLFRALFVLCKWQPAVATLPIGAINLAILVSVLVGMAWFMALAAESTRLEKRVQTLEGMLSICGFCKKIRSEGGDWEPLDAYLTHHSNTKFSHGLCPNCANEHYPDMFKK